MTDPLIAATGIPSGCAIAWSGKDGIYVEIPTKSGPPYITRYPKTASGLQSALNILLEVPAPSMVNLTQKNHPAVRRFGSAMQATPETRVRAAELVRRMLTK